MPAQATEERLEKIGAGLASAPSAAGETLLDTGAWYAEGRPVVIHARRRAGHYDLDDAGAATAAGGKPPGWLDLVERLVADEGFNVNRAGVLFVRVSERRDVAAIALRLADTSLAVYAELLDLAE